MQWGFVVGTTGFEASDLLLPKQGITLTNYYILPDFGRNRTSVPEFSGVNAELCRKKHTPNSPRFLAKMIAQNHARAASC